MPPPERLASARVAPRPAATTLILRDAAAGLEVLMLRRSLQASFMPGAYVFPGGAVDAADGDGAGTGVLDEPVERLVQRLGETTGLGALAPAFAVGALRECFEECGLWLGAPASNASPDLAHRLAALRARLHRGEALHHLAREAGLPLASSALQPFSRWVTPVGVPKRFDTLFVLCRAPDGQLAEVDAGETTHLAWVHPSAALAASARGEFQLEFATASTVRALQAFDQGPVQALLDHAAAQARIAPVQPRLRLDAQRRVLGVLMPGQPGYDEAEGDG